MTQLTSYTKPQRTWKGIFHAMWLMFAISLVLLQGCEHDPVVEPGGPGPDPIDTTGNPIDTTGNPIDTTDPGIPCNPNLVYFDMQILPILKSNCAKSGCHDAITHQEGIILDSYENVMGSDDVVKPYDLEDSEMFEKITESDHDDVMPPPPNQRLNAEQINLIATWILQGAQDLHCDPDGGSGCNTTNVTFSGFVSPLLNTNCVGCHSGGAPSGGITLNTHAGVRAVALNGRLFGAISHAPGFQPMPRGSAKLPQCSIDKIKAWIDEGAQNN